MMRRSGAFVQGHGRDEQTVQKGADLLVAIVVACDRLLFAFLLHFRFTGRRRGVTSVSTKRKEVVVHGAAGGCGEKGEGRLGHEGKGQVQGEETRAKLSEA